ncbi:MAG: DUF349 domain-containing protein [Candidatus Azobacteroides sp.]|nr:DUF349 domain-containing protein [Candidatus Azobacteroides sp.]
MNKLLESENIANENISEENKTADPAVETISNEKVTNEELSEEIASVTEPVANVPVNETVVSEIPAVEEPIADENADSSEEPGIEPVDKKEIDQWDKSRIIERLDEIVHLDINEKIKNEIEVCKQAFYKIKKIETEEAEKAFIAQGGTKEDFKPEPDEAEDKVKELLAVFRDKKVSLTAQTEKIKERNLATKKQIIEKLKELIESKDDFYRVYNEFRKLQQQWKEAKQIPESAVNDLWKEYQHYSEKFYDLLKINNEMRDYDFKKNLELKQALCEAVEKLDNEKDVVSAFYQLQKLHQEWREIGPVAKELREEIWSRFKKASSVINKKHQEHFESLRLLEQRNLEEKTALCAEVEAIDYSKLTTFKDWDEQHKQVLDFQEKWKTIGFAPKKNNVKIFERFRTACDVFFRNKSDFYKNIKETMDVNLEKKKALCEKAEALKNDENWKETTDQMIALQKEWRSIGPVSRKHSDVIWKRFISACDYFFEQKNKHFSSQKTEEVDNLKKKKEIIEKINSIDTNLPTAEAVAIIRDLITEWNRTGFVPFREKDKIHKEYRKAVDKHFDRLKLDESERRLQTFKSNLSDISHGDEKSKNKLLNERDKLMRTYERLKSDIQTYENNIGFLSVSSKGGGGLMKEMNRKINSLKEELNLIVKKIEVIDENFEK